MDDDEEDEENGNFLLTILNYFMAHWGKEEEEKEEDSNLYDDVGWEKRQVEQIDSQSMAKLDFCPSLYVKETFFLSKRIQARFFRCLLR